MPAGILVGLIVFGILVYKVRALLGLRSMPLTWAREDYLDYSPPVVREAVRTILGEGEHLSAPWGSTLELFPWGDARVSKVRFGWRLPFGRIPQHVSVAVAPVNGRTLLCLRIDLNSKVMISRFAAEPLDEQAEYVLLGLLGKVKQSAAGIADVQRKQKRTEQRPRRSGLDADFGVLGLQAGASLQQVQTAYRDACRKYHPDRLAGQNLAPHLVDLATQRFTEVTASYHRLRDHLAAPSAA